jgi:hypothetical protein
MWGIYMAVKNNGGSPEGAEMNRLIETLRGIIGALNAHGLGSAGDSIPVSLARLETRLDHLEKTLANNQRLLMGLVVSVVTLVIKMVIEGVFLK